MNILDLLDYTILDVLVCLYRRISIWTCSVNEKFAKVLNLFFNKYFLRLGFDAYLAFSVNKMIDMLSCVQICLSFLYEDGYDFMKCINNSKADLLLLGK